MRLLHPTTLDIAARRKDIPKTVISHCWSECFKWLATKQTHPKMFINHLFTFGQYMRLVYNRGIEKGCKFDRSKIDKFGEEVYHGFNFLENPSFKNDPLFDSDYLFSDAVSLYLKDINIFPDIFGDKWRKYVPMENLEYAYAVIKKTLEKRKKRNK